MSIIKFNSLKIVKMAEEIKFDFKGNSVESIEIDSSVEKKGTEKHRIDFMDNESKIDDFITKKTKQAVNDGGKKDYTEYSAEELRDRIRDSEKNQKPLTVTDFDNVSRFIITLYDVSLSNICRMIGGDETTAPYKLSKFDKDLLQEQLTMILAKYQANFKIEFLFLATICIVSTAPIMNANKLRVTKKKLKEQGYEIVKPGRERKSENGRKDAPRKAVESEEEIIDEKKDDDVLTPEVIEVVESKPKKPKVSLTRRRGNPQGNSIKINKES